MANDLGTLLVPRNFVFMNSIAYRLFMPVTNCAKEKWVHV